MDTDQLNSVECLQSFKEKYGRPLRVLHIGNIANNAYNNAKLLNKAGLDCDVICYDYYHIMGCPEWEDADFEGDIKDQFYPNWWLVNLNGFKRPVWFAQGPLSLCIYYLIARRDGKRLKARFFWHLMEISRHLWCLRTTVAARRFLRAAWRGFRPYLATVQNRLSALRARWFPLGRLIYYCVLFVCIPFIILYYLLLTVAVLPAKTAKRIFFCFEHVGTEEYSFEDRVKELVKDFAKKFPERGDKLTESDLLGYKYVIALWRKLFSRYDIIQAYSTDPILPLLCGKRPYVAYSHGTLRDIPFQNDLVGKRTLLSYDSADAVVITNADSIEKARYIKKDGRRIVFGLHGFDERRVAALIERNDLSSHTDGRFGFGNDVKLFFAPARHHWKDGFPTWLKGNDNVIEAVKIVGKADVGSFKVAFVEWGKEVGLSRKLIEELGIDEYFCWVTPLCKTDLLNAYRAVDCVIDQFVLPCLGGITMEVMAVGETPVITLLDDEKMKEFYGETIPLYNCSTPEEIAAAMLEVIKQPDQASEKVRLCGEWMSKYHSHRLVVEKQIQAYKIAEVS